MKKILILLLFLSFGVSSQTSDEIELVALTNQIRTNPKSFISEVDSFILRDRFLLKLTKDANTIRLLNGRIKDAKLLISFLTKQKPINQLKISPSLYVIAKKQAEYISSIGKLTHNGPNNEDVNKRFSKGYLLCGENCAVGNNPVDVLILLLIDSGNKNKGHRKNIFNKDFTLVSVGNQGKYWVQDFGY